MNSRPQSKERSSSVVSSLTSRKAASIGSSPASTKPLGKSQLRFRSSSRYLSFRCARLTTTTPDDSRCGGALDDILTLRTCGLPRPPDYTRSFHKYSSDALCGCGQRRADEVVECAERGLCALAHRDDDLLVRYYGAISGGENAGHGCPTARVDLDFAARRQLHRAFEPVGVRYQPDLYEHARKVDRVGGAGLPVPVDQADHAFAVAQNLAGLRTRDDGHVGQSAQLVLQNRVGAKLCVVLDE